jgi:hypothetical protein
MKTIAKHWQKHGPGPRTPIPVTPDDETIVWHQRCMVPIPYLRDFSYAAKSFFAAADSSLR